MPQDVPPGTYRTTTYTDECYWTRLSGFRNGLADWIASRIGSGYQVVTIGLHDKGFDSNNCGTWTSDLSKPRYLAVPGDGTFIVGVDIQPGLHAAAPSTNCYWARLSGFGGTDAEVIEDGSRRQVDIAATDVGFTSSGCGEWSSGHLT